MDGSNSFPKRLLPQRTLSRSESVVGQFLADHSGEEFGHLHCLGLIVVEGVPSIGQQLLEPIGAHVLGTEDHLIGRVVVPVGGEDALLAVQVLVGPGVGKGGQDREFGQIQFDLHKKVDQALDIPFRVLVQAEQDGALHADAVVVITFDAVADIVRGVEDRLIDIPGAGLGGQVEHFGVVFDGVAAPLLLQGDHLPEQIHFPCDILGQ